MRRETLLDAHQSTIAHRGKDRRHSTFVRRPDQQATSGISEDWYSQQAEKEVFLLAQHLGEGIKGHDGAGWQSHATLHTQSDGKDGCQKMSLVYSSSKNHSERVIYN